MEPQKAALIDSSNSKRERVAMSKIRLASRGE